MGIIAEVHGVAQDQAFEFVNLAGQCVHVFPHVFHLPDYPFGGFGVRIASLTVGQRGRRTSRQQSAAA